MKKTAMRFTFGFASLLFLTDFAFPPAALADCASPQTQQEMNICAAEEFRAADGALNAAYKTAIEGLNKNEKSALKRAQRAWITYRDLACESYGLKVEGGSMQPMLILNCKTRLTEERTSLLKLQTAEY